MHSLWKKNSGSADYAHACNYSFYVIICETCISVTRHRVQCDQNSNNVLVDLRFDLDKSVNLILFLEKISQNRDRNEIISIFIRYRCLEFQTEECGVKQVFCIL